MCPKPSLGFAGPFGGVQVQQLGLHESVHVCLFLPGLVGTEFGLNARHGGPDSRTLVRRPS